MGGVRAIEQLRPVVAELHMADIRETISIPFFFNAFNEDGTIKEANYDKVASRLLDQLQWWAAALAAARRASSYIV